ncbi:RNA polymerase sigma factor [Collinsella tanakaei]|nr:RNA polymerase sigma factor [Collinsella tanakaei]
MRTVDEGPRINDGRWESDVLSKQELKEAIERHRDMVFRIAFTYMRNAADADDVTQDVFVKLMHAKRPFESDEHLRNWLVRVAINTCKSLFRCPWRRVEDIENYAAHLAVPTHAHGEVFVALMRLPEKYRVPLVLYYYGGYPTDEIADLIKAPGATVRTRLARGRAKLKMMIEG